MNKILPTPEGLHIEESTSNLVISYHWYKAMAWFLVFFAIFWNGFMLVWFLADTPILFKIFGSLHVAVGIGLVWYILCLFVNTTTITITRHELQIRHTPLPSPLHRNMTISRTDISQIYIVRSQTTSKSGSISYTFALHVVLSKNESKKLSIDCDEYDRALFFKRKMEQYMRIEPKAVEGEYIA